MGSKEDRIAITKRLGILQLGPSGEAGYVKWFEVGGITGY